MATPPPLDRTTLASMLGRAGYGPAAGELDRVAGAGWQSWVEEQLRPGADDAPALTGRLADFKLRIHYKPKDANEPVDEMRPLRWLDQPIEASAQLIIHRAEQDGAERRRPREEVIAATILRAVYSRWQLREVMVSFWHDHFNVDAWGAEPVAVSLPVYDREVIRAHAFGNFRAFLEAVATSTAMQYYLSNHSSRAGAANENYARELFELHTLGRDAYLNDHYDRWRDVPGALQGHPAGYIDQDVYEAARAFTGWTIEDGAGIDGGRKLPETGKFAYVDSWHDGYQKRVLATEFEPFQPAMADGRKVLDLVAAHPATARALCTKLCRRFVGDTPSQALVDASIKMWTDSARAPDQIAQVLRLILTSPDFAAARGSKVKRPLTVLASFARATGIEITPGEQMWNALAQAGQRLFGWPTPTGLPDTRTQFISSNSLRIRWEMLLSLARSVTGSFPLAESLPDGATGRVAIDHILRLLYGAVDPALAAAVARGFGEDVIDQRLSGFNDQERWRGIARAAALAAMAPEFQVA